MILEWITIKNPNTGKHVYIRKDKIVYVCDELGEKPSCIVYVEGVAPQLQIDQTAEEFMNAMIFDDKEPT